MDDIERNYFKGIIEELKNTVHPEEYHFRNGNHPGSNWYLKTVCPTPNLKQIDKIGYGVLWSNIERNHPNEVKIVPHAYDWHGNEIPYMASIWINIESDVIIKMDYIDGIKIVLVDRDIGNQYYVENIKELIDFSRDSTENYNVTDPSFLDELDIIDDISDLLEGECTIENSTQVKEKFRVLDGGKHEDE